MCTELHTATARVSDSAALGGAPDDKLIADLVTANHILFCQGVVDAFGHVSVRHDKCDDRFLLARNMAPAQVSADDIVEFTLDGSPVNAAGRRIYLERFIHSEIYRAWPDVRAIVHSHSASIVPLTVVKGARLRALFHMAGFIGPAAPVFEIRDVAGCDSDLLIRDAQLGAAFAQHFCSNRIVLMRGHGSTVVGQTLSQAVFRAVYAEINARYQGLAMQLGEVDYLTDAECEACAASNDTQIGRAWELWKLQATATLRQY